VSRRVRSWPLVILLGLAAPWLGYVWLLDDSMRQFRVLKTIATAAAVVILALVWLLALSGLPRRARLVGLATVVATAAMAAALFRVRGVTGDFVPMLSPRWERPSVESLPPRAARTTIPAREGVPATEAPELRKEPRRAAPPSPSAVEAQRGVLDYPQFLGPERNGVVRGVRLARDWSARPPRLVWRQPIGPAWSSFAVAGDQAVTQEQRGEEELVVSYDLATGSARWFHADRVRYATVVAGEGPRATPTVRDGRVYAMGATGRLNALDLHTGGRLWGKDVVADNGAESLQWGRSGSPLVAGQLVIVNPGGPDGRSLVAYHKDTGERVWGGGQDRASYSSPLLAELAGRQQVVILNNGSVAGHDPATGALLWEHAWPHEQPSVAQPLPLSGDLVLVSAGYGVGSKLFRVSEGAGGTLAATLVWESPRLKSKFANFVHYQGHVYGLDDGVMTCIEASTGERRWKSGRYGHGQVLLVGDDLLVQTEEGEVVLVAPDPGSHRERARFAALEGKTWNPPALAGRFLLVRNDREAACYELPLEGWPDGSPAGRP
jgi:outer membrane protein assembly factor BamB